MARPQNVVFTYGLSDPNDPSNLQEVPQAWKVQWTPNSDVIDNPGQVRAYGWSLSAPANAVLFGRLIVFSQTNDNALALLDIPPFTFDGNPDGVSIDFFTI